MLIYSNWFGDDVIRPPYVVPEGLKVYMMLTGFANLLFNREHVIMRDCIGVTLGVNVLSTVYVEVW